MHACIHTYMHACMHTYIYTCTCINIAYRYAHMMLCANTRKCTHIRVYIVRKCVRTFVWMDAVPMRVMCACMCVFM